MQTDPKQEMAPEEEQEAEAAPLTLEPMLCDEAEEGKLPHSLDVLHHNSQSASQFDAVMVAVHLLMLETGFLPQVRGTGDLACSIQQAAIQNTTVYRLRNDRGSLCVCL